MYWWCFMRLIFSWWLNLWGYVVPLYSKVCWWRRRSINLYYLCLPVIRIGFKNQFMYIYLFLLRVISIVWLSTERNMRPFFLKWILEFMRDAPHFFEGLILKKLLTQKKELLLIYPWVIWNNCLNHIIQWVNLDR